MAIRVALNHKTKYRYPKSVWLSPHVVRLRPAPHCRTPILSYSLKVTPAEHFLNWQQDPFSNQFARFVFPKKTKEFSVEVDLVAELTVQNPFDFFIDKYAETYPFAYDATLHRELAPYLETLPAGPLLTELIRDVQKKETRTVDYLVELNSRLQKMIKYLIRLDPGIQTAEETLTLRSGSCRDSAWLLVQLLRHLGLAARFVSGYSIQLTADVKALDGPSGVAQDVTDLHAWTEVYLPGAGWIGLDPTSGLFAGEGHIPLACTADPANAAAITGFFNDADPDVVQADPEAGDHPGGDGEPFEFSMSIKRIHEDPRVTKPYTEDQWTEIEALGHQIDADLQRGDVRLTMGGEPTFVSIDDMDGEEWTTAALGPKKYELADNLLRRLRDRFSTGGFLHHGQGKWYPGESLPRWSFGLYWRKDGQPIWTNPALVADESKGGAHTETDAHAFVLHLAGRLDVPQKFVLPGYEDVWYYLWKERRLPVNVDPFESKLDNEEDRKRLAKVFEQGLDKVVGYTLPLKREHYTDGTGAWISGDWFLRQERMYLIPGDSAMGFRLPLDSLPWTASKEPDYERDAWETRGTLPSRDQLTGQRYIAGAPTAVYRQGYADQDDWTAYGYEYPAGQAPYAYGVGPGNEGGQGGFGQQRRRPAPMEPLPPGQRYAPPYGQSLPPARGEPAPWLVRTALCVEARGGVIHVFMPPQRYLEDYLELVAAVEDTAASLNMPVLVEGYPPPHDSRLNVIKVTPDPGVIEVNTVPNASWDELVRNTTGLYEEARFSRLGTEKFMVDGRHTGTGGGNHIVVGGPTPADSPFLRRPDLLKSLLGFWHNHPSLSYLFSGQFVGPTSQAPRVDEARNDQVFELELAFKEVPDAGESGIPPWLTDRIFRNLLIDSTGNTHRAEFCIDKMYTPEGGAGRLGLLEMRAFEMPPHARMSLTQHLLLRALIARFWKQPYSKKLVRWRTEIHDRFLLPHFIRQDLEDVIDEMNQAGYPIKPEWFEPHMEFRFPFYGSIEHRGVTVDLRQAIEPWHVLGEEGAAGGTVRYVDSSVERMQVLVNGMTDSRHVVTVNGVPIPLHPTGTNGQFVAGVRYRAWRPPNCLHPTIDVHSPLVFDVIDTWNQRSIGGCTYYVAHPGGRNYSSFPVNAYEAESRRFARFYKVGHTPGPIVVPPIKINKEFPLTLDLRWH